VLLDRTIQIDVGLAHQAVLQLTDEDVQLPPGGTPRTPARPCEPIPGPGEGQKVRPPSAAMGREHRAHSAVAVDVRAHDDPLVTLHSIEHRLAGGHRHAVDREAQVLDEPGGVVTTVCHRLWSAACAFRRAAGCAQA
jgi:hypothetical protein